MPTLIDSFVVELGLDSSKFDKQTRAALDNARKRNTEIENDAKRLEQRAESSNYTFANLQRQLVSTLATFAGTTSVAAFTRQVANTDAQVARLARTTGTSEREIAIWSAAAKAAGGSADGVQGAMSGLIGEFQRFAQTGESSVIPYFRAMGIQVLDASGKIKSWRDLMFEIARWGEGRDPAQVSSFMRSIGADEGSINLVLRGTQGLSDYLAVAEKTANTTKANAAEAERLTTAFANATTAAESLLRAMGLFEGLSRFFERFSTVATELSKGEVVSENSLLSLVWKQFKSGKAIKDVDLSNWGGMDILRDKPKPETPAATSTGAGGYATGGFSSQAEKEAFIRDEARRRGIDPDAAMRVARSEGFNNFQSTVVKNGVREPSWGAFQLYTGGGLGNTFQKQTGLDPSDRNNERATVQFALDHAARVGNWNAWYGARNTGMRPNEGLPSPGSIPPANMATSTSNTTKSVSIGTLTIVTKATDAAGIAAEIRPAIERQSLVDQANVGLN